MFCLLELAITSTFCQFLYHIYLFCIFHAITKLHYNQLPFSNSRQTLCRINLVCESVMLLQIIRQNLWTNHLQCNLNVRTNSNKVGLREKAYNADKLASLEFAHEMHITDVRKIQPTNTISLTLWTHVDLCKQYVMKLKYLFYQVKRLKR